MKRNRTWYLLSKLNHVLWFVLFSFLFTKISLATQCDTTVCVRDSSKGIRIITYSSRDLTFTGTKIETEGADHDSTGKLVLGGYISAYYALYSDSNSFNNYQKFPTVSPRSNSIGLNIAQLSAKYRSCCFRGLFTLHIGDIPQSAWSAKYNILQEANMGLKIIEKLWVDAGFFRTHIGLESIQPRENITSSLATTTYFEPYFMSGVKLTYQISKKLTTQIGIFNSFNGFEENNKNKAFNLSFVYDYSSRLSITNNTITSDESNSGNHQRLYNNTFFVYKKNRWNAGGELNFGVQKNSKLNGKSGEAIVYSGLIAAKYRILKKLFMYGRVEYFEDKDEMLTGPILNQYHNLVGLNIVGYTYGFELKIIQNSYIRVEYRLLKTETSEKVFIYNGKPTNYRNEGMLTLGVWF